MFDQRHYVPILTAKQGEFRALRELTEDVRMALTPLLEIPPLEWDFENDQPSKTIDEHISGLADSVEKNWGNGRFFLDAYPIANDTPLENGQHPISFILAEARSAGLHAVPVTGIERDPAQQVAVRDAHAADQHGICIRMTVSRVAEDGDVESQLNALMSELGVTPGEVDFVLDFGPMNSTYESTYTMGARGALSVLPHLLSWRSLSLAGSAFPNDLSDVARGATSTLRRTEWHVWQAVRGTKNLPRVPTFSDYAINSPEHVSLDFRFIKRSANIRYTHFNDWVIVKGQVIKKGQVNQLPGLAAILRLLPQYMGRDFSAGDRYIDDCASGTGGPGSATTWRQVGTNHHLTFVVRQIATLFGP